MTTIFQVPLQPNPQQFTLTLSGTTYTFTFQYRNAAMGGWFMDIGDAQNNPLVQGMPLVTGANLLNKFAYLGFVGGLYVQTTNSPDTVPTFENLGGAGVLYYATNP